MPTQKENHIKLQKRIRKTTLSKEPHRSKQPEPRNLTLNPNHLQQQDPVKSPAKLQGIYLTEVSPPVNPLE